MTADRKFACHKHMHRQRIRFSRHQHVSFMSTHTHTMPHRPCHTHNCHLQLSYPCSITEADGVEQRICSTACRMDTEWSVEGGWRWRLQMYHISSSTSFQLFLWGTWTAISQQSQLKLYLFRFIRCRWLIFTFYTQTHRPDNFQLGEDPT